MEASRFPRRPERSVWRAIWPLAAVLLVSASAGATPFPQSAARVVVIGDYGANNASELAVSKLIKNVLKPEFIVTAGDNNYGNAADIDDNIGKYYHAFIGNYRGRYGAGAETNRFFPAIGNHDWQGDSYQTHLNYFTLPGNERYYDFVQGPIHWFILNSDTHEPAGNRSSSRQGLWFSNRIASATAPWRLVVIHDPPYSSSSGNTPRSQWPFQAWGASAVISGNAHNYERIVRNNFPYFINGAGGQELFGFDSPLSGSASRYRSSHGALLVEAGARKIQFQFWAINNGGTLIDSFTMEKPVARLAIQSNPPGHIVLSWPANLAGFALEEKPGIIAGLDWKKSQLRPVLRGGDFIVPVPVTEPVRIYRLVAPRNP